MPSTALGEFVGTLVLLLLGNGVVAGVLLEKSKAHGAGWMVITAGWAFAVLCGVLVAVGLGAPGELNPAVTLANVIAGTRTVPDALAHVAAQMTGAIVGATLVWLHYLPHWSITRDQGTIHACFCTAPAIRSSVPNLISEVIGTMVLVLVASAIGTAGVSGATPATNLGPALVGALVWGIGLSLGGPTGYAINPARDLGPRLAHAILPIAGKGGNDWGYAWIPVVGPLAGGALAALLWSTLSAANGVPK
ncbi:MIP/aquaporin family protein [Gemmatimonas groenlandica]|uniref:Aquaporin family protein n=1 Tax=Gemmatimonas groenlandica TaxID=2732249 RepID=A0A6M4ISQ8_9BACT|nr:MIP/aquaporin family protein [Gemmatimonas groenlandica]QJR37773.1 aquaporin family protein [Gemmatimonas groenlandica]